jgi:hypothetical protein
MDAVYEQLMLVEERLANGSGEAYRRHLADDAVVVVPGAVLDRDACAAAMDASPGWDERELTDVRAISLSPDSAMLTYRWRSRRGEQIYAAVMSSVYARRDGDRAWRLVLHQQTPEPQS